MTPRVRLERPEPGDAADLAALARASRRLHRPWVYPHQQARGWRKYFARCREGGTIGYLLRDRETGALLGVVNLNDVARGMLQSACLGFYVHAAHAGRGVMTAGLSQVLRRAFTVHRLHRLEANVQPGNSTSLRLVQRLGFRREGFSPRLVKIGGRWRDHERWAITREDWHGRR
jgi:[ribosomal protein S5]-alanine N-acetyltransferase